ncbi:MAG: lytic murein transglycosylase, partial [Rhodoferax sp.]
MPRLRCLLVPFLLAACAGAALAANADPARATRPAKHKTAAKELPGPPYARRSDAMQAAEAIAEHLHIEPRWVRQVLGQARYMASVARLAAPPAQGTAKNWDAYRKRFIEPLRIRAGVKFWLANRAALERAEQSTGVPPEIVVGIVGVETLYGQQTGKFRVLDALATLAFDFPAAHPRAAERAAFFLAELESYLDLTQRTGTDPLALRGSYAGAMGLPQFMPSSWQKYAID